MKKAKIVRFVVVEAIISTIGILIVAMPQMLAQVWDYMSIDLGYKWVVNMMLAFGVGLTTYTILKRAGATWLKLVISIIAAVCTAIASECIFWHPEEIGKIISAKVTAERAWCLLVGMVVGLISFVLVENHSEKMTEEPPHKAIKRGPNRRSSDTDG